MSDSSSPLKATLKAGSDYSAPWLTVDANTPEDLVERLTAVANLGVSEALVNAANVLKAVNAAAPIAADVASPPAQPPAQQGGWNTGPTGNASTWSPPTPPSTPQQQGARLHPEGIKCTADGNVVQFKEVTSKKNGNTYQMWVCPNQRSRGDGHYSAFAD